MWESLQIAWTWLMDGNGYVLFAALWAVSEFLSVFSKVKANGIFQAIRGGIKWCWDKFKALKGPK